MIMCVRSFEVLVEIVPQLPCTVERIAADHHPLVAVIGNGTGFTFATT